MKTLIITGGSRGIGAATARMAAQRGYAVCIVYLQDREAAGAVVEAIRSGGGTAIGVQADVSRESDVIGVFEKVDGEFGRLTAFSITHWRFLETSLARHATIEEYPGTVLTRDGVRIAQRLADRVAERQERTALRRL